MKYCSKPAQSHGEDILAPKQFHKRRFSGSERRGYETILRDWRSLHEFQEGDNKLNALLRDDISTIRIRPAQAVSHEEAHNMVLKVTPKAKNLSEY